MSSGERKRNSPNRLLEYFYGDRFAVEVKILLLQEKSLIGVVGDRRFEICNLINIVTN